MLKVIGGIGHGRSGWGVYIQYRDGELRGKKLSSRVVWGGEEIVPELCNND